MTTHGRIERELYDYLQDALPPEDRSRVEQHLEGCTRCRATLEAISSTLAAVPRPAVPPAESRSNEFWVQLVRSIEQGTSPPPRRPAWSLRRWVSVLTVAPGLRRAALAVAAAAVLVIVLLQRTDSPPSTGDGLPAAIGEPEADEGVLLGEYLRRSKALLVELESSSQGRQGPLNLSVEQAVSRELVEEGRRLTMRPLDVRSTALVADLEPIMISVANSGDRMGKADMEVIRTSIRQRNLLFKVRMAELAYDPRTITAVMDRTQGR